ncbi:MAG: NAD(P)/FAD-dependent oxidoreductase [Clostridia bacterium]|nr:NAD(P)/FAD-dependent oxidoreductase [Clostridia bacterium]
MHTVSTSAKSRNSVAVIGGGPAGMMAAVFCAQNGADVCLFEKNEKTGKKLYITGKGRCNFTNACNREEFLLHVPRNSRFLYSALSLFSPDDMMAWLENAGCPVKVERGRRAFPRSDKASDVTRALCSEMTRLGVSVRTDSEVAGINTVCEDGAERVRGLKLKNGSFFPSDAVIVATGGLSYPSTGSTGDGYRFARETGHPVTDLSPSLTGIELKEAWPSQLQGLSLKNVRITIFAGSKKRMSETGEMLFTHYGISGPLVLEASSILSGGSFKDCVISLDMKPAVSEEQLLTDVSELVRLGGAKTVANAVMPLFPRRMTEPFLIACGLDPHTPASQLPSSSRRAIAVGLKRLDMTPVSLRPFSEAIITRGGVDIRSVNPSTMGSRLVSGLYFAGEVLDVDAFTGGYNLQIAFSTGALAGRSAALQTFTA